MSALEIYRMEQGSPEWFEIRKGIPTASEFHTVMAKVGPRGGTSHKEYVSRSKYMRTLAAEIILGQPVEAEWGGNLHTERGKEREAEARDLYGLLNGVEPKQIGFVRNGNCGASPDSTIDTVGLLELKDAIPSVHIARLEDGTLPSEHRWQVIGELLVCEWAEWIDFMSHCRGLPPFIYRVTRDKVAAELAELREGIDRFCAELAVKVEWLKRM
jgi:hypothetical protein